MNVFNVKVIFDANATISSAQTLISNQINGDVPVEGYVFGTDKVYKITTDNGKVVEEDIRNYPLSRHQERLTYTISMKYASNSPLANIDEATDLATAICDAHTESSGSIVIVKLVDEKFGSSDRIVLGTKFANSYYIAKVNAVVTGNAANGELIASNNGMSYLINGDLPGMCPHSLDGMTI